MMAFVGRARVCTESGARSAEDEARAKSKEAETSKGRSSKGEGETQAVCEVKKKRKLYTGGSRTYAHEFFMVD